MRASRVLLLALVGLAMLTPTAVAAEGAPAYCQDYVRESQAREARTTGTGERIAVLGDSYVLGVGLKDVDEDWTSLIPGRVKVFGFGGSGYGATTSPCGPQYALGERAPAAMRSNPDVVVVVGGLNDVEQTPEQIAAGFDAVIAAIGDTPTVVVGPAAPPSRADGARRVDEILRGLAEDSERAYLSMVDRSFTYVGPRFIHLSLESHRDYAALVAAAIVDATEAPLPTSAAPTGAPSSGVGAGPRSDVVQPDDDSSMKVPLVLGLGVLAAALVIAGLGRSLRRR